MSALVLPSQIERHLRDKAPVLYGLRVLVVSLKWERQIEYRIGVVGRGVKRTAQTIDRGL